MNVIQPPSPDPKVNARREKARAYCAKKRERRRQQNAEWIRNNRDRYNAAKARYRLKVKLTAMKLYADPVRCVQCGFDKIDGLVLDHIENDGKKHRVAENISHRGLGSGTRIYEVIKRKGRIDGLQVLCANCNTIKQLRYGRSKSIKDKAILAEIEALYGR